MDGSASIIHDHSPPDSDHWLNGFLQQNCEEARKRVQEERNIWNLSNNENSCEELDLSAIFNFTNDDESGEYEDSSGEVATEPTISNDGVSIYDNERHIAQENTPQQFNNLVDQSGTLSSEFKIPNDCQFSNFSPLPERSKSVNDALSIDAEDEQMTQDSGRMSSANLVTEGSSKADWDFQTELVEVSSMGIVHAKQQLSQAINEFYLNIVEKERLSFRHTMKQIEETVNEVLAEVERLDSSFKLRSMSAHSFYEIKSRSEVDILVVLENVTLNDFVIEDLKTPAGYARLRLTSSPNMATSSPITSSSGQILEWCTETQPGDLYFSPKKLCKAFAAIVSKAAGRILKNGSRVTRKRVSFSDTEATVAFSVNLIPAVVCPQNWPLCAYWLRNCSKKWPDVEVKNNIIRGGMHLIGLATGKDNDPLWKINFCSARRLLFQSDCDGKQKCLRILKVLLERDLSRPKGLLPLHLENIVMWASRKHRQEEDWAENMMAERFLEMLVALHKCLNNHDCYHFFVPTVNLFNELKPEVVKILATKVKDILKDPLKYLKN